MNDSQIINNQGNFSGGYFVLNQNRVDTEWDEKKDFFVTLPYQNSIKREIINLIRNSTSSIKLCSFIISDQDIFQEIENVLKNKNVAVFILTQLDSSKFSTSLFADEEMIENHWQEHLDIIKKLYSKGAHVRATGSAHAKFMISDRKMGLLTSANIKKESLINNPETGVYISDNKTLEHLDRLFDLIFQHGTQYTKFISASSNKQFIISRQNNISENSMAFLNSSDLRFTYEKFNHSLYHEIVDIIKKATGDVFLSTYSIVGLELLPEFVKAVKLQIEQGLSIYIFSRGMNYRNDHIASCTQLAKFGCRIYGDVYNHSKCIITPEKSLIFTANIDGNRGLKNGFEVGAILDKNQAKDMELFIKWQIKSAPYVFSLSPSKSSYFSYYSFHCKEKGFSPKQLPKDLNIKLHKSNSELVRLIDETPCYLKIKNKKVIQIQIGWNTYQANYSENTLNIEHKINTRDYNLESYLLQYNNIKLLLE